MSTRRKTTPGRTRFGFVEIVRQKFAFLTDFGFSEADAEPTIVRYRSGDLGLNVYHGRQSYEVGVQVGHGDEQFSMSELIRVIDPGCADEYRNPAATTSTALESGVEWVAGLVRRYGERALRNEPEFFGALRSQRESWADSYALDVLVNQTRPKAQKAFREGRYQEAAELYEKIASRLTHVEQAKLAAARKRS